MIDQTLHRKLNIKLYDPHLKPGVNSVFWKGLVNGV